MGVNSYLLREIKTVGLQRIIGPTSIHTYDTYYLAFWKISNGHISATDHPIHFTFGSTVGFSRSADRMALFPVGPNPRWRPAAILKNFEWLKEGPDLRKWGPGRLRYLYATRQVKQKSKVIALVDCNFEL